MKLNVLVVDDSSTARAIVIKTLRLTGLEWGDVHEAANGRDALDILKDNWVDLVLTDIHMPVMDGLELVRRLEADGLLNSLPVIVTSSDGNRERIAGLCDRGIRAYLRKPFTPETACSTILEVMGIESA